MGPSTVNRGWTGLLYIEYVVGFGFWQSQINLTGSLGGVFSVPRQAIAGR